VHEWTIRLDRCEGVIYVGISPKYFDPTGSNDFATCVMECYTGNVYGLDVSDIPYLKDVPDDGLPVGSLINVCLDLCN
jgi:hypothetical protein